MEPDAAAIARRIVDGALADRASQIHSRWAWAHRILAERNPGLATGCALLRERRIVVQGYQLRLYAAIGFRPTELYRIIPDA